MLDAKQQEETYTPGNHFAIVDDVEADGVPTMQDNLSIFHANGVTFPGRMFTSSLPAPLTSLIGREQAVAAVSTLVCRPEVRLVTLTGPGGVGKTQLGLAVASAVSETFPDGIIFVSLAPLRDVAQVVPTIAQAIGLREARGWSRMEHLQIYLQRKSLLLLLDNFEQVRDAAPLLVELLQTCPQLHLLVTSRVVLHATGEHAFPVPPLALPNLAHLPGYETLAQSAAVALFLERSQAIRPDFHLTSSNIQTIAEICIRLDGLPLAIELAASRVKLLSPQALLARLDQRLQLLTGGMRDAPARQQTLRQTVQWSYDLLHSEEQLFFRQLSVFAGGCTLEAAEAIVRAESQTAPISQLDGANIVSSLIDQSLLEATPLESYEPRLTMLETIREYGMEMLAVNGQMEDTRRAHAAYYLHFAGEAEPQLKGRQQVKWLGYLEQEHANLREALSWLIEKQETEKALSLCGALGRFWDLRGYWSEGRAWFKAVFALPHADIPSMARAKALRGAGELAAKQDDSASAHQLLAECVSLYQQSEDRDGLITALGAFWFLEAKNELLAGHALSEEQVLRCYTLPDVWERARLLEILGRIALHHSDIARATPLIEESLTLARALQDKTLIAQALHLKGNVLLMQGDLLQAEAVTQESFTLARELDTTGLIAQAADTLGDIAFHQGNLQQASFHYQESLALARQLGDRSLIAIELYTSGNAAMYLGDLMQAELLIQESLEISRALGNQIHTPFALYTLGDIALRQGNVAQATNWLQQGLPLALALQHGRPALTGWYLLGFARVAAKEKQLRRATCLFGAAESWLNPMLDMDATERTATEREVANLRTQLGEIPFQLAWNAGGAMTPKQALAIRENTVVPEHSTSTHLSSVLPLASLDALTSRESEVLRLLTTGLTNPQIADHLIISPLTVNAHLRSIYSKLSVTSRAAATRYALEHHLV